MRLAEKQLDFRDIAEWRQQTVSIDIDDVLFGTWGDAIPEYNRRWRTHLGERDYLSIVPKRWGAPDEATVLARLQDIHLRLEFRKKPPLPGAVALVTMLVENDNTVAANTSRPELLTRDGTAEHVRHFFGDMIAGILHSDLGRSKAQNCIELGASAHIDDLPFNAATVAAQAKISTATVFHYHYSKRWPAGLDPRVDRTLPIVHACNLINLAQGAVVEPHLARC